jgi:hypothetical protein
MLLCASGVGQQLLKFKPTSAKLFESWRVDRWMILLGDDQYPRVWSVLSCLHSSDAARDAVADYDEVGAVGSWRISLALGRGTRPSAWHSSALHGGNLKGPLRIEVLEIALRTERQPQPLARSQIQPPRAVRLRWLR